MIRLKETYIKKIIPMLKKELELSNVNEVPRLRKIVVNSGIGPFRENKDAIESFIHDLSVITGQKPYPRKARLSEAGFKIKQGDVVGYAVTLRGARMWAFLDKLINIALPRVRDFRGLKNTSFDENGNYSIGIKEHVIFPEVDANTTKGIRSLQITIVTDSNDLAANKKLLLELGVPIREE